MTNPQNTEPRFSFFITEEDTGASHMHSRNCDSDTVIGDLTRYISNYSDILRTSQETVNVTDVLTTIKQMSHCILWVLKFNDPGLDNPMFTEFNIKVARGYGKKNSFAHCTITKLSNEDIIRQRLNEEAKGS